MPLWRDEKGRGEKRLDASHCKPVSSCRRSLSDEPVILTRAGDRVVRRSLDFYAAVGRRLAGFGGASGERALTVVPTLLRPHRELLPSSLTAGNYAST